MSGKSQAVEDPMASARSAADEYLLVLDHLEDVLSPYNLYLLNYIGMLKQIYSDTCPDNTVLKRLVAAEKKAIE